MVHAVLFPTSDFFEACALGPVRYDMRQRVLVAGWSVPYGLDHIKVYTCGEKFLPTFQNRSMPVKSMAKANHTPKYGECLSL